MRLLKTHKLTQNKKSSLGSTILPLLWLGALLHIPHLMPSACRPHVFSIPSLAVVEYSRAAALAHWLGIQAECLELAFLRPGSAIY